MPVNAYESERQDANSKTLIEYSESSSTEGPGSDTDSFPSNLIVSVVLLNRQLCIGICATTRFHHTLAHPTSPTSLVGSEQTTATLDMQQHVKVKVQVAQGC